MLQPCHLGPVGTRSGACQAAESHPLPASVCTPVGSGSRWDGPGPSSGIFSPSLRRELSLGAGFVHGSSPASQCCLGAEEGVSWGEGLARCQGCCLSPSSAVRRLHLLSIQAPEDGPSLPYRQTIVHAHLGLQIAFSMW